MNPPGLSTESLDRIKFRFQSNMVRLTALMEHTLAVGEKAKPGSPEISLRSDLLRANAVFLHATFEDMLRNLSSGPRKKWSFSGASDLRRLLRRLSVDVAGFEDLMPAIGQLAHARIRIVHYADLGDLDNSAASEWGLAHLWMCSHWTVAVIAFYHRIMHAVGPTTLVEDRARENGDSAFAQNVEVGRALIDIPRLPHAKRKRAFSEIASKLDSILDTLDLHWEDFVGPDGQPLPGALRSDSPSDSD